MRPIHRVLIKIFQPLKLDHTTITPSRRCKILISRVQDVVFLKTSLAFPLTTPSWTWSSKNDCFKKRSLNNIEIYIVFVDFTKAFDTVNRETLLNLLQLCGSPDHATALIVTSDWTYSTVVKQFCIRAPTSFKLFFATVFTFTSDCTRKKE